MLRQTARLLLRPNKAPVKVCRRNLISLSATDARSAEPMRLASDILEEDVHSKISVKESDRAYLATLLPASQAALPARTMADSLLHGLIPIGSCPDTSLRYTSYVGGARLGRLLQEMDHFAACVLYRHILNPKQEEGGLTGHLVITASMDHLRIQETIKNDQDIVLVGHVTWVGASSAEVGVRVDQRTEEGTKLTVCEARFFMVGRDAATGTKSAPINPLLIQTEEEKFLFNLAEKNVKLRRKADIDSLFKEPPSKVENNLIHKMFLSTIDHKQRSFSARVKPDHAAWMSESKLKSIMLCEPEHKNAYNKVFGGKIMEKCMDLAFTNAWVYTGAAAAPVCTHIDDVIFLKAVEIGDLLYFHAQVVFTHENKVQVRVSAEVLDKANKNLKLTNVLQITFKLPSRVPHVVPRSYNEAMAYLTGRRHFLMSLENTGKIEKGMAEMEIEEASNYTPMWTARMNKDQAGELKSVKELCGEEWELWLQPELTQEIRERELAAK